MHTTRRRNVLVFPGGTEIGLEIHASLRFCKEIRLFSAGLEISNHAPFVFRNHFSVPSVYEKGWCSSINRVIRSNQIDYVFPAHDDVLLAMAERRDEIAATVVTSPTKTCLLTRFKSTTYDRFKDILPTPQIFAGPEDVDRFPVFVKPDRGQGSQGTHLVINRQMLDSVVSRMDDLIIMQYLPGNEYTIDCFNDRDNGLLFCRGRRRIRTRSGISMSSAPVEDDHFVQFAKKILARIPMHGAWFFQLKRNAEGHLILLEIAPRIAGTMALHRIMGVNFPLLSIYEQERAKIKILASEIDFHIDRSLANRFHHMIRYDTVYVDLDDTLILFGRVNTILVRLLYQCVNHSIRLVLLTRTSLEPRSTHEKHRIAGLFDEIIVVPGEARKSIYIEKGNAILIDDSFSERLEVHGSLGIPTFDATMIEGLIDDRH